MSAEFSLEDLVVFHAEPKSQRKVSSCRGMSVLSLRSKAGADQVVPPTCQRPTPSSRKHKTEVVRVALPVVSDETKAQSKFMTRVQTDKFYADVRSEILLMSRLTDQAKKLAAKPKSPRISEDAVLPTMPSYFRQQQEEEESSDVAMGSCEEQVEMPVEPTKKLCCCSSALCPCEGEAQTGLVSVDLRFQAVAHQVLLMTDTDKWTTQTPLVQSHPGSDHWVVRLLHRPFSPLQFKFIVDGNEYLSPEYKTQLTDRSVANVIVPAVFEWDGSVQHNEEVFIVGDFDGWKTHPLKRCVHRNRYIFKTTLPRPGVYNFNFVVDGVVRVSERYEQKLLNGTKCNVAWTF